MRWKLVNKMSEPMKTIETDKLSCKIGQRYLIKDITWQIYAGEHWVVYGSNGSGKTTLLSIITGFQHATSGTVKICGENITRTNALAMRKRIGFVSSAFFDKHYSKEAVLDIVLSGKYGTLGIAGEITLEDIKLAKSLLKALFLEEKIYCGFDMLSKGERQNVMIARALFGKPDILILDEPCNGLDAYNRAHLFKIIKELANQSVMNIIYVTHYIEEIDSTVFQNALLLKNGRVFAKGALQEVMTEENLSALLNYDVCLYQDARGAMSLDIMTESNIAALLN